MPSAAATRGPTSEITGDADVPHCSAMTRKEGSKNVFVNGQPWSCQGDYNTSHELPTDTPCPTHSKDIAFGSSTVKINGDGAGRVGDSINACTSVAAGSENVFAG